MADLIAAYDVILLDAYGVLVDHDGVLPGAARLIGRLNTSGHAYFLVSNSASKLPERAATDYARRGLAIPAERIVSAGSMLVEFFSERGWSGRRTCVLGTGDSRALARAASAVVLAMDDVRAGVDFEVLVLADQAFNPFWETFDGVLGSLFRRLDAGSEVDLVLPNPDLIYPRAGGFGFTSGSLALMLERVLAQRYPGRAGLTFTALGKPEPGMFREALRRAGGGRAVMIGDQLETDVAGARRAGIDSALLRGGVSHLAGHGMNFPTFQLASLHL